MNSISLAFIKKTTTHTLKHKHFSNCCLEPVSYAAAEEDSTSGLVIDVFDDLDKVGADVVLLHGCPQSCMQNPVEGLPEIYEDMVQVLLLKYPQHQQDLYHVFIDFKKAFERVWHAALWATMKKYYISTNLI